MRSNWLRMDVAGGLRALLNLLEETGTEIQKKRIFGATLRVFVWGKEIHRERSFISPECSPDSSVPQAAPLFSSPFQALSMASGCKGETAKHPHPEGSVGGVWPRRGRSTKGPVSLWDVTRAGASREDAAPRPGCASPPPAAAGCVLELSHIPLLLLLQPRC